MSENEELVLTKKQRYVGNIVAGAMIVLCGVFLLLCGTNVIKLAVKDILAGSILLSIGLVFFITGFLHKNVVSIWIGTAFLVPAVIEFLVKYTNVGYGNLYPLYIAIPAIASLVTIIYGKNFKSFGHLSIILFFGIIAAVFSLQSSGALSWAVTVPILVVTVGLMVVAYAVITKRMDAKEDEDSKTA